MYKNTSKYEKIIFDLFLVEKELKNDQIDVISTTFSLETCSQRAKSTQNETKQALCKNPFFCRFFRFERVFSSTKSLKKRSPFLFWSLQ